jgi:sigma-E factor negative regulatory protein RseA
MKHQLSALIDGELDLANAEQLIKAAKADGELNQAWAHYHLIGDAMRALCTP